MAFCWIMVHSLSLSAKNSSSTYKAAIVHSTSAGRLLGSVSLKNACKAERALAGQKPFADYKAINSIKVNFLVTYFTGLMGSG